jgi:Flp pilus assembly pilin Flp
VSDFQRFITDETGPELVEWAVVTVVLLMATAVVLLNIGEALRLEFLSILCDLAPGNSLCSGG